jgi:hypothetical protein
LYNKIYTFSPEEDIIKSSKLIGLGVYTSTTEHIYLDGRNIEDIVLWIQFSKMRNRTSSTISNKVHRGRCGTTFD